MKFFAIFALAAIFTVAAAYPYEYDPEQAEGSEIAEAEPAELTRVERSYGGHAKCGKAVLVACAPLVKKVKCKGGY